MSAVRLVSLLPPCHRRLMLRRTLLVGLAAAVSGGFAYRFLKSGRPPLSAPVKALPAVVSAGTAPVRSVSIRPVPLGAGGFVTGIDQSRDGQRLVCRTDVCNGYVRDVGDTAWRPLFSPTTLAPADFDPLPELGNKADGRGVAGVRIAPSDKDVLYASYSGYVWRSGDGGRSLHRTALPQLRMLSNAGAQSGFNRTIDIHPRNPDEVIVATWGEGVWRSSNGGGTWQEIDLPPSLPLDGQPGVSLVLFDRDASRVHIFVGGIGLFVSDKGAAGPFSPVPGGPTRCSCMIADREGPLHLCEHRPGQGGRLWRYHRNQGWRQYDSRHELVSIAADPTNARRLYASGPFTYGAVSTDGGESFIDYLPEPVEGEGEIRWITALKGLVMGHVLWDSVDADRLWFANGVGVSRADLRTGVRSDWSAGIEELACISGVSVPGGATILTAFDKPLWRVADEDAYTNYPAFPTTGKEAPLDIVTHGTYVDYAGDDPAFLVAVVNAGKTFDTDYGPGFSTDGGKSWTRFAGEPPQGWSRGGCIAASTRRNIVILPSDNGFGAYTLDGGENWATIQLDGDTDTSHFASAYYVSRKNITADKTRPGVFALVYAAGDDWTTGYANPLGGVWVTHDGGRNWRQVLTGVIGNAPQSPAAGQDPRQYWQCQLDYVPGRRGELLYTPHADAPDDRLWWSQDDGATWAEVHPSIRNVASFGFGRAAQGETRPAVYFSGAVDGTTGLFASFDWFRSKPTLLSRFPSPQLAPLSAVVGDANRFGRVWMGTAGAGWLLADVELL